MGALRLAARSQHFKVVCIYLCLQCVDLQIPVCPCRNLSLATFADRRNLQLLGEHCPLYQLCHFCLHVFSMFFFACSRCISLACQHTAAIPQALYSCCVQRIVSVLLVVGSL